jgi:hypothetical protein
VVISVDQHILRNKVELQAVRESGLKFFFLTFKGWLDQKIHEYAWKFMKVWPDIVEEAEHSKKMVFRIRAGTSLKVEPIE